MTTTLPGTASTSEGSGHGISVQVTPAGREAAFLAVVAGELDSRTVPLVTGVLDNLAQRGARTVTLDTSGLVVRDRRALAELVAARTDLRASGCVVVLAP